MLTLPPIENALVDFFLTDVIYFSHCRNVYPYPVIHKLITHLRHLELRAVTVSDFTTNTLSIKIIFRSSPLCGRSSTS